MNSPPETDHAAELQVAQNRLAILQRMQEQGHPNPAVLQNLARSTQAEIVLRKKALAHQQTLTSGSPTPTTD